MSYYTERHGMRMPIEKTYTISVKMYALLFDCCEKYYNNLAWKYPEQCGDGYGCCGLDHQKFSDDLSFEIPTLYRDDSGRIVVPHVTKNIFEDDTRTDEYDQYALLDYIEFFANNCMDVTIGSFHSYYGHYHLACKDSRDVVAVFRDEINDIFTKTGLLYQLSTNLEIERIVENSPLTPEITKQVARINEPRLQDLLVEAILLYKSPNPNSNKLAVEKIWDALENLKTYFIDSKKKQADQKVSDILGAGDAQISKIFEKELSELGNIGNNYHIRHYNDKQVAVTDSRHYDYFFNRCLSLIALAIQYLK